MLRNVREAMTRPLWHGMLGDMVDLLSNHKARAQKHCHRLGSLDADDATV